MYGRCTVRIRHEPVPVLMKPVLRTVDGCNLYGRIRVLVASPTSSHPYPSNRARRIMLLNFNWAGVIADVRYQTNVNREGINGPLHMTEDGEPIMAKHDMKMVDNIFASLYSTILMTRKERSRTGFVNV
jgi:hypothetical protein